MLSYDIRKFFPRKKPEDRVKKHQSEGSDECPGMGTEEEEEEKKKITKLKPRITKEGLVLFEEDKSLSRMCKDGDYLECGTKEKTVSCVKDVSLSEQWIDLQRMRKLDITIMPAYPCFTRMTASWSIVLRNMKMDVYRM